MKLPKLALLPFLVSACTFSTLDEGLTYLVGSHIDSAVNVLGFPNQRTEVGPYTVYVWDNNFSATIPIFNTTTSTTTGTVGTTPIYGTTTSSNVNYLPVQYDCQIKLQVDAYNVIRRWEYAGNAGGCRYYANGVKRLIPK